MRLKVTFVLEIPTLCINTPGCLDSIVAQRLAFFEGLSPEDDISELMPIKKIQFGSDFFYLASWPSYRILSRSQVTHYQNTSSERYGAILGPRDITVVLKKRMADMRNGPWKQKMYTLSLINTDRVSYIADVEDNKVELFEMLVRSVNALGKKRAYGYGLVKEVLIEQTDEPIIRPVPVEAGFKVEEPFYYTTIKPPYWRGERLLCGIASL